jgi:hypothetical protein
MPDDFVLEPILRDRLETLIEALVGDDGIYVLDQRYGVSKQQFVAEFLQRTVIVDMDMVDQADLREYERQCVEDNLP